MLVSPTHSAEAVIALGTSARSVSPLGKRRLRSRSLQSAHPVWIVK